MKSSSGLFCASGAEVGPQVLFEMQTCAAMDLCARRHAASRTGRQSSRTELALSWSSVVSKKNSLGELVWLASVGPQFVCQQNSQAELAHRTCALVIFCVPQKIISANLSGWPQLAPNLSASRTRRQSSHTELALPLPPVLPPKKFISANLSGWPQLAPNLFTDITHTQNSLT